MKKIYRQYPKIQTAFPHQCNSSPWNLPALVSLQSDAVAAFATQTHRQSSQVLNKNSTSALNQDYKFDWRSTEASERAVAQNLAINEKLFPFSNALKGFGNGCLVPKNGPREFYHT